MAPRGSPFTRPFSADGVIEDLLDGIPLLLGSSNYVLWGRQCYARLDLYGLLEFVKGNPAPPERHGPVKDYENHLKIFTARASEARRLVLTTSHLMIQVQYGTLETAKLVWDKLRDVFGPLSLPQQEGPTWTWTYPQRTWKNFVDCKYSGEDMELFCQRYRDAVWLCEEADIKIALKSLSLQFVAVMEPYFPVWCNAKKSLMPTIEDAGTIPELDSLIQEILQEYELAKSNVSYVVPAQSTNLSSNFLPQSTNTWAAGPSSSHVNNTWTAGPSSSQVNNTSAAGPSSSRVIHRGIHSWEELNTLPAGPSSSRVIHRGIHSWEELNTLPAGPSGSQVDPGAAGPSGSS